MFTVNYLVVIDSNEKTYTQRVYNQDKVVQWIRWMENEGGYRWFHSFDSPKITSFFNHAFCKSLR